jgi:hypothetical protein
VIDAYRQYAESVSPQSQPTLGLKDGWAAAENLVGWLVLLAVRDDWCDRHQALLAPGSGFLLDMPLSEKLPQAVAFSRLKRVKAELSTGLHGRPSRRRLHPGGAVPIEEGWTGKDTANYIKREILRQVAPERPVPTVFGKRDNEYLDERLAALNARDDPAFLPIELEADASALADPAILDALREDLPSLHILRISRGDSTEVLLFSEQRLGARLDDFLSLAPDLAARGSTPSNG